MVWLAIYAAELHQGDCLQANSDVQKLGERDRVYVLTQTVPLQKNQTIFKKDWNQIVILLLEYVFDEEMISNGNMRGLTNG